MNATDEKRHPGGRAQVITASEANRPTRFRIAILAVRRTLRGAQTKAFLGNSIEAK